MINKNAVVAGLRRTKADLREKVLICQLVSRGYHMMTVQSSPSTKWLQIDVTSTIVLESTLGK